MVRRIVLPEGALVDGELVLPAEASHHVRDVLRLDCGDQVLLCDGAGLEADGEIVNVSRDSVRVHALPARSMLSPDVVLTLIQAVGKGQKLDTVVRQATELGAHTILPVTTERTVSQQASRVDRWRTIAEDALRVSGRAFRPDIEEVQPLEEILSGRRSELALCLTGAAERSLGALLQEASSPPSSIEILIGPEGGLSRDEVARAVSSGFVEVHFGPYTLRTETAGPAVVAAVLFWAHQLGR